MTAASRRDVMRGGLAAAALVPLAGASASATSPDDVYMRDLWRRYIEATKIFSQASNTEDNASTAAHLEQRALVGPWTPVGPDHWDVEARNAPGRQVVTMTLMATTKRSQLGGEFGPWLVKEFRTIDTYSPSPKYSSGDPFRWQPYPEAETAEDALALSRARADKEWRSLRAKLSAISRKHRCIKLKLAIEQAYDGTVRLAREIVAAPCSGPVAVAVKLALAAELDGEFYLSSKSEPDSGFHSTDCQQSAYLSIYREAVKNGGYDPAAEWRNTPGI